MIELVEVILVIVAVLAIIGSMVLIRTSIRTVRDAEFQGKCRVVRHLGWLHVHNEVVRGLIALGILVAAVIQISTEPPQIIRPSRTSLQVLWLTIAVLNLWGSVYAERTVRRLVRMIEKERMSNGGTLR